MSPQVALTLFFSWTFIAVSLWLGVTIPDPSESQERTFRTVLALATAAFTSFGIPGVLNIEFDTAHFAVSAAGALAVLFIVYKINPPKLLRERTTSPAGRPGFASQAPVLVFLAIPEIVVASLVVWTIVQTAEANPVTPATPTTGTTRQNTPTEAAKLPTATPIPPTPYLSFEDLHTHCSGTSITPFLIPNNLDPNKNSAEVLAQFNEASDNDTLKNWTLLGSSFGLRVFITSNEEKNWLVLHPRINITIRADKNIPDHVNGIVPGDCGGAGDIRVFTNVNLEQGSDLYMRKTTNSDADFFTLQPGEPEAFEFDLTCASPGLYTPSIEVPYDFAGQQGTAKHQLLPVLCPQSFTTWYSDGTVLFFEGTYKWQNGRYDQTR